MKLCYLIINWANLTWAYDWESSAENTKETHLILQKTDHTQITHDGTKHMVWCNKEMTAVRQPFQPVCLSHPPSSNPTTFFTAGESLPPDDV